MHSFIPRFVRSSFVRPCSPQCFDVFALADAVNRRGLLRTHNHQFEEEEQRRVRRSHQRLAIEAMEAERERRLLLAAG